MANEKNNTNELVSEDDDPTAELEVLTIGQHGDLEESTSESDEHTSDFGGHESPDAKKIGKLQYDIEQLHAKWLGLETEIATREELSNKLNAEIDDLRTRLSRKDNLIKKRDRRIKALKAEIRGRDEQHRSVASDLRNELEANRAAIRELPELPASTRTQDHLAHDEGRLERTEAYADSLRRKLQDVLTLQDNLEAERERLSRSLSDSIERNRHLEESLANAADDKMQLNKELSSIDKKHAEEVRILRFELSEAQDTISESQDISSQLASDLLNTRGVRDELEQMIGDSEKEARKRIEGLEKELAGVSRISGDLEQKLNERSDTIKVLLSELARKSDHIESINEIGEVISDIDVRISERIDENDEEGPAPSTKAQDRVTRVLVGKIGKQLLRFPLFKDRLTIGRTEDNDIQLNAVYISRRHAVVQADGEATRVIDWGSKNGVYVNSERVKEHFLKNGDIVTIGNAHFRYEERAKRDN